MSKAWISTKRQSSLRNLPVLRQHRTSYSPPKILPTVSQNRQLKKNNAKELTTIISKFNGMNKNQSLKYSEDFLRVSIHVLRAFSIVQNNFQDLFTQLTTVFKRFTLALDDAQIKQILQKYRIREGCSYRKTCFMMENESQVMVRQKNQNIQTLQRKLRIITEQYKINQGKWTNEKTFLQSEIQKYKKLSDVEYVRELQQNVQKLKSIISDLQTQNKFINKEYQKMSIQISERQSYIDQLNYDILKLKENVFDLKEKQQKVQNYFQGLKIRFDELLAKMMSIKQSIQKVEAQNDTLVSERTKLVNRAAVSYEDLTPRPKYKDIFDIGIQSHINSTAQIFENLVKKSNLQYKEITTDIILRKKHRRLIEAQAIRARLSKQVIEAKENMKQIKNIK